MLGYKSLTSYVGILASLFAGATYVPLNPNYPVLRTRVMAQQAGPPRHFFLSFLRFSIVTNYCTYTLYLLTITKATTNIVEICENVPQKARILSKCRIRHSSQSAYFDAVALHSRPT